MHSNLQIHSYENCIPKIEQWIDLIVEYYNIGSYYYGTLSVLFDAISTHLHTTHFNVNVTLAVDEDGLRFIIQASEKDQLAFIKSIRSNKELIRLLRRLCNGFMFNEGDFSFRISVEGMSIVKLKGRQSLLSDYFRGEHSSALYHDKLS